MWPINRGNQKASGPFYLWDLIALNQTSPAAAAAWAVIMLSLAGLPPIAGFVGKLGVFWSAINSQLYFLVTVALVSTLLSTIYYFKILKISYVDTPSHWSFYGKIASLNAYLIAITVGLLIVLLWHATPIILASHITALACSILAIFSNYI
jgi:NADH-quinone oxidoreductase subunit N